MYDAKIKEHHEELDNRSKALIEKENKWAADKKAMEDAHSAE